MEISLNGIWRYKADPENRGIENGWFSPSWYINQMIEFEEIFLPNNWNIIPELERYEGIVWFFLNIDQININEVDNCDLFLRFKAVNYHTSLWINGHFQGVHEGNFLPFKFRINAAILKEEKGNTIIVRVENFRKKDRIPTIRRDWFNWGGIYRDIDLIVKDKYRINWCGVKTRLRLNKSASVEVLYEIRKPKKRTSALEVEDVIKWNLYYLGNVSIQNKQKSTGNHITLVKSGTIRSKGKTKSSFSFQIDIAEYWTPANPQLYKLELSLTDSREQYEIRFGIREITIRKQNIYLNNRKIHLHGVSLHEELIPYGRAIPIEKRRKDVVSIKDLGFNALRTGHYPHDESIYTICDEEGILVLEEIPVYWGIDFSNAKVLKKATQMFRTMIRRDFNHPSVIMWSAGNEVPVGEKSCQHFMTTLVKFGKTLDDSRLISCVVEFWTSLIMPKTFTEQLDVLCCNFYFGWYYLHTHNLNFFIDCLHQRYKEKPWFITEFGAGAKHNYHDSSTLPIKYSEERQFMILKHLIRIMNAKAYISGWFIWIYRDFRSHMRLNEYQKGFNRKGIVSEKNKKKMIACLMTELLEKRIPELRHHKIRAFLGYLTLYPILKITSIITGLMLGRFSDSGEGYYKKQPTKL